MATDASKGGRTLRIAAVLLAAIFAVTVSCRSTDADLATPDCQAEWQAAWSRDSSLVLCVPPAFVRFDEESWQRSGPNGDFFSIELVRWPEDSAGFYRWPPRLSSSPPDCQLHCVTVDSLVEHTDRVGGIEAHTDVGLVTGGMVGFQRTPMFKTWWAFSDHRRGFAQGWAHNPATLDTVRQALATLRIRSDAE